MNKDEVRQRARVMREAISEERRQEAQKAFMHAFSSFDRNLTVLSYCSFGTEFDTRSLNQLLVEQGRLLLPKTVDEGLRAFRVTNMSTQLEYGFGGILEPIPSLCEEVSPEQIEMIVVPALAFDPHHHRIGYGMGCYDRFLSHANPSWITFGLGFREQFLDYMLPIDEHDRPLSMLQLF